MIICTLNMDRVPTKAQCGSCGCKIAFVSVLLQIFVWKWDKKLQNSLDNGLIMILQSTMQPGNIISAWRYFSDDRTNHARHRDLVNSSSRWNSSTIFLTSLNGIGSSCSLVCTPLRATHTCEESKSFVFFLFSDFQPSFSSIKFRALCAPLIWTHL